MSLSLKPLNEQVMVITGASSGIGLATAEAAAEKGVKLVLGARSEETLHEIASRLGSEVVAVKCDVTVRSDLEHLAEVAIEKFGRIDTWVNNAGLGMYGRVDETDEQDARKLFDVNFWSIFNGSVIALKYLKQHGGALINLGSEASEAAVPLLGVYVATKHAVKGLHDSLRIEIEEVDKAPVSLTLIQPTAVDTPFPQHAKNYMAEEAKLPTPQIEPSKVAEAILSAATKPQRYIKVGLMSKINTAAAKFMPGVADKVAAKQAGNLQYDEPPRKPGGSLYEASEKVQDAGQTHGSGGRKKQKK